MTDPVHPIHPNNLKLARLEASLLNVAFAARRASDALTDFAFAAAVAMDDDTAVAAKGAADAAIAKASNA